MLAGFQIGAFTGWVVGYFIVHSRLSSSEGISVIALQAVPVSPDTIFCMALGAAIGALVGLSVEKPKADKAKKAQAQTQTQKSEWPKTGSKWGWPKTGSKKD